MGFRKSIGLISILAMLISLILGILVLDKHVGICSDVYSSMAELGRSAGMGMIGISPPEGSQKTGRPVLHKNGDDLIEFHRGEYFINDKSKAVQKKKEDLVLYRGAIKHIFFHPLIAYPERAFDGDSSSKGYDEWFVTVKEFKSIIESVYKKGYILVDINSIYKKTVINGKVSVKMNDLYLPKGKQPLIISIDDLNYYDYMIRNGNVFKLVLDGKGEIATYSTKPDGTANISRENEIIPLLDTFVNEHPDFSFDGAKGCIALTGFQGILGYRTNLTASPAYDKDKKDALAVVKRLKETGWSFASHSYGHINLPDVSYERVIKDSDKWEREVEPLIGQTNIFIYPYGGAVKESDIKFKYLQSKGFVIFCGVGPTYLKRNYSDIIMDRLHIDGVALKTQRNKYLDLFDASKIVDSVRPKENLKIAANRHVL